MVQSIDRAMQIVHLLISEENRSDWPISDIAAQVGLPLSTTHRLIGSLIKHDLVAQVPETKQYKVGPKWMEIGLRQLEQMDMRTAARPVMERLASEVKESVYLSLPNMYDAFIIDRVDSPGTVRVIDNLGERIPMHIGAPNKSMLANMDPKIAEAILVRLIDEKEKRLELLHKLPEIRKAGYCISYGEKTEGTASVAAPIIGFGRKVVGALSIGIISYQISEDRLAFLVEQTIRNAAEISKKLGG
ncbi:DNA-binding IclR family transcriptional regulator [Paenibacillus forsythiae]|uniref:DNA-binding IclR family transcriptional regulator n=1 Tax=Paenibacillus forsythiae TaxID=365616 RepID=A0ABU3H2A8_9BACL|nr:IclR family transcriptional regulator [Paenibacillus forsythiae]MDT3424953.1 DNA-binding IclR family transcriptional regulator [Paenibacillus forsythiae]